MRSASFHKSEVEAAYLNRTDCELSTKIAERSPGTNFLANDYDGTCNQKNKGAYI